jgi:hypothetical protein
VLLCIMPMLVIAIVECRLFAYFLLIRERYKIMNRLINFYRENIDGKKRREGKIFFITDFPVPRTNGHSHLLLVEKVPIKTKLRKWLRNLLKFLASLLSFRPNGHSIDDLDEKAINQAINYIDRVMSIQTIFSRLHKIFNLVSAAYGIQIIMIIAVQFITLTTLVYYFTMRVVR